MTVWLRPERTEAELRDLGLAPEGRRPLIHLNIRYRFRTQ